MDGLKHYNLVTPNALIISRQYASDNELLLDGTYIYSKPKSIHNKSICMTMDGRNLSSSSYESIRKLWLKKSEYYNHSWKGPIS